MKGDIFKSPTMPESALIVKPMAGHRGAVNAIQEGDTYRNRAQILDFQKNSNTLYVKCIPMPWDMNNRPAEAEMEQWTTLQRSVLKVRNRLTCHRTDKIYDDSIRNDQELPAVYPISALTYLYAYMGNAPFTKASFDSLTVINLSSGSWGRYKNVSEHWMAFVDGNHWGIGTLQDIRARMYELHSGSN